MKLKFVSFKLLPMLFALIMTLSACSEKGGSNKIYQVAPERYPSLHIDHYEELTALYGTERMETLKKIGVQITECNVIHGDCIGVPLSFAYSGVEMDVFLRFTTSKLSSVDCEKVYVYPEETEQAIVDILAIGAKLEQDLGQPHETDVWNNWYEEQYDVEMDPEVPSYRDAQEIKKILSNETGGSIMWWDMTSAASSAVKDMLERFGDEGRHGFSFNVECRGGEIVVSISY